MRVPVIWTLFTAISTTSYAKSTGLSESRDGLINYASFVQPSSKGNITFAIVADQSTEDVYMYLSGPASYQWIAVGTGSEMDGSTMWLLYEGSDKDMITLSSRVASGESEPSHSESINCNLVNGTIKKTGNDRFYSASIHCKNITSSSAEDGRITLKNTRQPFLYAWGPSDNSLSTSNEQAGIRRHEYYGTFWVDMTKAVSQNAGSSDLSGKTSLTTNNGASNGDLKHDGDKLGVSHGVIMCVVFVIIFPLGAVILRLANTVKGHYITQSLGIIFAVGGVGLGLYDSTMYNHSKRISSGHQILGLIVFVLALAQWSGGLFHHLRFRKFHKPTLVGKVHLYAGPLVVLAGIINGFLGFNFSGDSDNNIPYGIVVAVIIVLTVVLMFWGKRRAKQRSKILSTDREEYNELGRLNSGHR